MAGVISLVVAVGLVVLWSRRTNDRDAVRALERRVEQLERLVMAAPPAPPAGTPAPAPVSTPVRAVERPVMAPEPAFEAETWHEAEDVHLARPATPRTRSSIERVVAEHALALVGGVFVLIAAVFFITYAIDQGWIGPWLRISLAFAFGIMLAGVGLRVAAKLPPDERTGRAIGSLHGVLVGTGAAVAFLAVVAAVRIEELIPASFGVLLELLVATPLVWLARTWRSQDLAAFGLGVALAAPMLVGADATPATIALLTVALLGSIVLAVAEQWPRLLLAAAVLTTPQLMSIGTTSDPPSLAVIAGILYAWWTALALGAVMGTVRSGGPAPRSLLATVLAVPLAAPSAFAAALSQYDTYQQTAWYTFLFVLAGLQLLLAGTIHVRWRERVDVLVVAFVGAGLVAAAGAVGVAASGVVVTIAWIVEAVALAALWSRSRELLAALFAVAMALAALARVVGLDSPPALLLTPVGSSLEPLLAAGAVAVAALVAHALVHRLRRAEHRADMVVVRALDLLAAVAAWYALALALAFATDAEADARFVLGAALAAGALVAVVLADRLDRGEFLALGGLATVAEPGWLGAANDSGSALWVYVPAALATAPLALRSRTLRGAIGALVIAGMQATFAAAVALWLVPPANLRSFGEPDLAHALLPLLAALAAVLAVAGALERSSMRAMSWRRAAHAMGALVALYAVSILVTGAFTQQPGTFDQGAQVALTLTWVALGVGALLAGTSRRLRARTELRIGAYALLALGALKLVLVDTVDLETPQRVLAFLATGLGLLGSAALEQRMRRDDDADEG